MRYSVKKIQKGETLDVIGRVNLYFPGSGVLFCVYDNDANKLLFNKAFPRKQTAEQEADYLNKKENPATAETADREVFAVKGDKEFRIVKQLTGEFFTLDLAGYHYVLTGSRIVRVTDISKSGHLMAEPVKEDGSHGGEKVYLNIHQQPVYLLNARFRAVEY